MPLPTIEQIEPKLLSAVYENGGHVQWDELIYDKLPLFYLKLQSYFPEITPEDLKLTEKRGPGTGFKWRGLVGYAKARLVKKGELDEDWPKVEITEKGIERLRQAGLLPVGVSPVPPPPAPQPLPSSHTQLVDLVKQMGEKLGYYVEAGGPVYHHDSLWKVNPYHSPRIVVEVCDKGNLDKDLNALAWANKTWGAQGILIVVDEGDFRAAQKRVTGHVYLVKAELISQLYPLLENNLDLLKLLFSPK